MTERRPGKRQLDILSLVAMPGSALPCAYDIARSCVVRGWCRMVFEDSFVVITPHGLRALADAMARGDVPNGDNWKDEAQRNRANAKKRRTA